MQDLPSVGQLVAGKYRIERVIGSGAMGVVMSAWHVELLQRVAVKFVRPEAMGLRDAEERFRREARAAARIRSEHVGRVMDVGTVEGGVPYMVMEYLEGHDLADELSRRGPLAVAEAVGYLLEAIEALAEAHAAGIVHRDLKPANLFLAKRADGTRIVKVLDFGVSKAGGTRPGDMALTQQAVMIGSPLYMSPEQMRSARDVDARADIWSLGVILFELVGGRPPYLGDSIPELVQSMMEAPPSLRALRGELPLALEAVVARCLERDPSDRFADVASLGAALVEFAPDLRMHVTRAQRLLGSAPLLGAEPRFDTLAASQPSGRRTVAAWGEAQPPSERRSSRRVFAGLGVLTVLVGALGVGYTRFARTSFGVSVPAVAAALVPASLSSAAGIGAVVAVPGPSAKVATVPPKLDAPSGASAPSPWGASGASAPSGGVAPAASTEASSALAAVPAPVSSVVAAPKPPQRPPPRYVAPRRPAAQSMPAEAPHSPAVKDTLPDFGGRR
ncbi:MAG TPA: protein kinase [Polyangiaceae bacterium]|nr:protein kinase [Polyangiaceae bacterium]